MNNCKSLGSLIPTLSEWIHLPASSNLEQHSSYKQILKKKLFKVWKPKYFSCLSSQYFTDKKDVSTTKY